MLLYKLLLQNHLKFQRLALVLLTSIIFFTCNSSEQSDAVLSEKEDQERPLFEQIISINSGINFTNTLNESPSINILTYEYFYNGGGVAIGDINNDGLDDIYFTANFGDNHLYINEGDFQFENITARAGVSGGKGWTTGVTMVDINSDGFLDIYVCRSGKFDPENRKNQLFINNQNETFTESAAIYGLDDPAYSTQALFFDFDRDNDLDMYLLNHSVELFTGADAMELKRKRDPYAGDKLFRNDEGKYVDISSSAGIIANSLGYGLGVAASDINGDGWMDIYVTNDYVEPDYLYINQGNGSFKESVQEYTKHISNFAMGVDIADFNNDTYPDIMVADMVAEDNYRQKTNMRSMNPEEFYQAVKFGFHHQYMHNTLQLNNGNQSFSEISQLAGVSNTDWSWATLFADFDNDGFKDLLFTNGFRKEFSNKDFVKNKEKVYRQNANADQQTKLDALKKLLDEIPSKPINNYIYKNNGNLTFENKIEDWGFDIPTFSNGAAVADLDNDGDLDIVINNIDQQALLLKNQSEVSRNHHLKVSLKGPEKNKSGLGSKVTVFSEGHSQVVEHLLTRGYQSSTSNVLHFGLGKLDKIDSLSITWPDGKSQTIKNLQIDQQIELKYLEAKNIDFDSNSTTSVPIFSNITSSTISHKHLENDYDDFDLQVLLPHKMSQFGPALAVADINGDALDDLFIGASTGNIASVYVQKKSGEFELILSPDIAKDAIYEDTDALFVDVDNDGDQDLYVVSGGNESFLKGDKLQDRFYINDGTGQFTKSYNSLPQISVSGGVAVNSDIDNDGDQDLFIGGRLISGQYPYPADSYLLINSNGVFTTYQTDVFDDLGMITSALWTDYDGDGDSDLMVAGEWMPITFIINEEGEFRKKIELKESTGWWNSLAQADMDNDGDLDYIAGNLGLNYKYKASIQEPFEIFASDFDENGNFDIVLGYYEEGSLFPLRGRQCSSEQMPEIASKFGTYDQFGAATLIEVYGEEDLDAALHYQASTFASSYIENRGDGQFVMHELPIEAQFSCVNSILLEDIDGDNKKDVLLAGNYYPVEVETTRNDASIGVVLKNQNSQFRSISVSETGFYLPGDSRAIKLANTANGKILIAAKNDDYIQILKIN